jgi:hypothetical protein
VGVIKEVEIEKNNEEELLLANYNTKERALALQAAYKEQLQVLLKKRMNILKQYQRFMTIDKNGGGVLMHKCYQSYSLGHFFPMYLTYGALSEEQFYRESLNVNYLLLFKISEKMQQSMRKDIETLDEEILIISKKAGLFQVDSELWNDLHKYIEPSNQFYNDYNFKLLNM